MTFFVKVIKTWHKRMGCNGEEGCCKKTPKLKLNDFLRYLYRYHGEEGCCKKTPKLKLNDFLRYLYRYHGEEGCCKNTPKLKLNDFLSYLYRYHGEEGCCKKTPKLKLNDFLRYLYRFWKRSKGESVKHGRGKTSELLCNKTILQCFSCCDHP